MGFFRSAFRVLGDVTSLGGTSRIRKWTERRNELLNTYHRLRSSIDAENGELLRAVEELKKDVAAATELLRRIGRILDPLGAGKKSIGSASALRSQSFCNAGLLRAESSADSIYKEFAITAGGLGLGTGTALASWGTVQVIAHASTGTAMATLHGAAASSAGWAWFGGGSLAAGGGGMALGHLVLPGIGTAVAVTFSSIVSHKKADQIAEECAAIENTNEANEKALATLKSDSAKVRDWERRLESEFELLHQVATTTRKRLFRFGFLTHIWRSIRNWFGGDYYLSSEEQFIAVLDAALTRFMDSFQEL